MTTGDDRNKGSSDDARMIVQLTAAELRMLIRDELLVAIRAKPENDVGVETWVDAEAIEKHFGVSRGTVHNWLRNESCPHEARGKIIRFKLSAVEAWFRQRGGKALRSVRLKE
jgi:Helix-turn-helix domain